MTIYAQGGYDVGAVVVVVGADDDDDNDDGQTQTELLDRTPRPDLVQPDQYPSIHPPSHPPVKRL